MIVHFFCSNRWMLIAFLIINFVEDIACQAYSTGLWPPGYYGYNRDGPVNGYSAASNVVQFDPARGWSSYVQPATGNSPWNYGIANKYSTHYYDNSFGTQYGPSSRYSMSSYPYSEFWRYYNQYPARNQYYSGYSR